MVEDDHINYPKDNIEGTIAQDFHEVISAATAAQ